MAPTQIRLRRICGILRVPSDALGSGAMAGPRVVLDQDWIKTGTGPG